MSPIRTVLPVLSFLVFAACGSSDAPAASAPAASATTAEATTPNASDPAAHEPAGDAPAPIRVEADGSRVFGSELDEGLAATELSEVIADPQRFAGQTVKTSGEITQVCQRMGCWMELRPAGTDAVGVRVPMANHSFFLPRDVTGHRATIQGRIEVAELDEATREHLESEGAQAAGDALSIEATGVIVH